MRTQIGETSGSKLFMRISVTQILKTETGADQKVLIAGGVLRGTGSWQANHFKGNPARRMISARPSG